MSTKSTQLLRLAKSQIGTKESPANSNRVKYNTWFYGREVSGSAYPWCMAFVQWCYHQAGVTLPFKECVIPLSKAQPGDVVIFDFPGGAATDHTGIFEGLSGAHVITIDGNTGTSNDANGGAVMRRSRSKDLVCGVIHPKELDKEAEMFDVSKLSDKDCISLVNRALTAGADVVPHVLRALTQDQRARIVADGMAALPEAWCAELVTKSLGVLDERPVPDWAKAEYREAVDLGITDGTAPTMLIPRYQAAIMALRAVKAAKK